MGRNRRVGGRSTRKSPPNGRRPGEENAVAAQLGIDAGGGK
ncbi:MAG: hypothetical protein ABW185_29960 [Sedimenticola sp.]